jgi:hypothetical protein
MPGWLLLHERDGKTTRNPQDVTRTAVGIAIGYDRIYVALAHDGRQMLSMYVGWTNYEAAGDAVQFYEGQCRRKLISSGNQNRQAL